MKVKGGWEGITTDVIKDKNYRHLFAALIALSL